MLNSCLTEPSGACLVYLFRETELIFVSSRERKNGIKVGGGKEACARTGGRTSLVSWRTPPISHKNPAGSFIGRRGDEQIFRMEGREL